MKTLQEKKAETADKSKKKPNENTLEELAVQDLVVEEVAALTCQRRDAEKVAAAADVPAAAAALPAGAAADVP